MNANKIFRGHSRRFLLIGVFAALLLGNLAVGAAEPAYDIDACAAPVRVYLSGPDFHVLEGTQQELDIDSCGDRTLRPLYVAVADSPKISITRHSTTLDLHVELPSATYDAKDLPLDGKPVAATPAADGSPALRLRATRLADQPYIGLQVENAPSDQLLRDVARVKHLQIRHAEHVGSKRITFHFGCVPTRSVVELIAQTSGALAKQDAHGGFDILAVKNGLAIEQLRTQTPSLQGAADREKLRATLQRIIALGQPGGAGEVQADISGEYAELGGLAMDDKRYVEAERYYRAELAFVERQLGKDHPLYALVLANVADTRAYQDDSAGSRKLYTQALALMEQHPNPTTLPNSIVVIETLASGDLANGRSDEAEKLSARAYARLQDPHSGEWVAEHLEHAREIASELEADFAARLVDKHNLAAAEPHFERALRLNEQLYGAESEKVDAPRRAVVFNLLLQKKAAAAADFSLQQIAASDKRGDQTSDAYVSALYRMLAIRANYGNSGNVVPLWERMIAVRRKFLGENDALVVDALRDLAILYRLDGNSEQASATEQRAAAIRPTLTDVVALKKLDEMTKFAMGYDPALLVLCGNVATQALAIPDSGLVLAPPQPPPPPMVFYLTPPNTPVPVGNRGQAYVLEQDAECRLSEGRTYAIHQLERAWQLRKAAGVDDAAFRRATGRLAELYDTAGDHAKADKVRASLAH